MKSRIKQTNRLNNRDLLRVRSLRVVLVAVFIVFLGVLLFATNDGQASASKQGLPRAEAKDRTKVFSNENDSVQYKNHSQRLNKTGLFELTSPLDFNISTDIFGKSQNVPVYERVCESRAFPPITSPLIEPPLIEDIGKVCSDSRFLIDRASTPNGPLDSNFAGPNCQSTATFRIGIDRYIGFDDALIANGLIGDTAELKIALVLTPDTSGFVGGKYQITFEDESFVISLGSRNNVITLSDIPIEKIKFPTALGLTALNTQ